MIDQKKIERIVATAPKRTIVRVTVGDTAGHVTVRERVITEASVGFNFLVGRLFEDTQNFYSTNDWAFQPVKNYDT